MSWISYAGVRSDVLGLVMLKMPSLVRPTLRTTRNAPPARHGELIQTDGAYEAIKLSVTLGMLGANVIDTVAAWLTGEGSLILSDDITRCYRAAVYEGFTFERQRTFDGQVYDPFVVTFDCSDPFRYLVSDPLVTVAAGGTTLINDGTLEAQPVLTVVGSGSGAIVIGGRTLQLTGMAAGTLTIDGEAKLLRADYSGAAMDGSFPTLPVGSSACSYSGGITSLKVLRNRRWL